MAVNLNKLFLLVSQKRFGMSHSSELHSLQLQLLSESKNTNFRMASESGKPTKSNEKSKKFTQEQIVATFNKLRQDQKNYVTKLTEVEQDLNEHSLVVDALKGVDPERVCYRMIGGVLVQRTVKEVLPAVSHNKEQLAKILETLNKQIEEKGKEINEFKEKHNIQLRKEPPIMGAPEGPSKDEPQPSSSVLVKTDS